MLGAKRLEQEGLFSLPLGLHEHPAPVPGVPAQPSLWLFARSLRAAACEPPNGLLCSAGQFVSPLTRPFLQLFLPSVMRTQRLNPFPYPVSVSCATHLRV